MIKKDKDPLVFARIMAVCMTHTEKRAERAERAGVGGDRDIQITIIREWWFMDGRLMIIAQKPAQKAALENEWYERSVSLCSEGFNLHYRTIAYISLHYFTSMFTGLLYLLLE